MKPVLRITTALLLVQALATGLLMARELTFEDRVRAQEAIERIYYSHQIGTTLPFEEAVPREVLESKVRTYLKKSFALERVWHTPVTAGMLEIEMQRIGEQTRMPQRLRELHAALGNDRVLIQECLARPALVDRLVRSFFAHDPAIQSGTQRRWGNRYNFSVEADLSDIAVAGFGYAADSDETVSLSPRTVQSPDAWRSMSVSGAPLGRYQHVAVWTGSLMIVWGGFNLHSTPRNLADGGRYDPAINAWMSLSMRNAPSARSGHTAVWTGAQMIVWGGADDRGYLNTGGRYDPVSDKWSDMSTMQAPTGRSRHTAVWAGSQMIIWGGLDRSADLNSGARYNPATDTWTSVSRTGAPSPREQHSAVWTRRCMIVWGGVANSEGLSTGGQYDPIMDRWSGVSMANAPAGRYSHTAVWTGREMIVWGGLGPTVSVLSVGGCYDPITDRWRSMSSEGDPTARFGHTSLWLDGGMMIWGGYGNGKYKDSGGIYDPLLNRWEPMPTRKAPTARGGHTAVGSGDLMIVWGGESHQTYLDSGGRFVRRQFLPLPGGPR